MPDLFERYLTYLKSYPTQRGQRASPATIRAACADLQGFIGWWEQARRLTFDVALVLDQDLWDWQEHRQVVDGRQPATINRANATLRAFFTWAHAEQLLSHNPAVTLHDLPQETMAPSSVPPEGAEWLVRVASAQPDPIARLRDLALLTLLSDCGLRSQEAADVEIRDLDLAGAMLTVRSGKGRTPRRIPLTETARRRLRDYLMVRCPSGQPEVGSRTECEPFLQGRMITKPGQPWKPGLTPVAMRKRLADLGVKAAERVAKQAAKEPSLARGAELNELARKLKAVSPHQLRHGLAYRLLRNGATPAHLQKILGHSRVSTSLRYGQPTEDDIRDALERANPLVSRGG